MGIKVQSLRFHTYDGVDRPEGAIYEIHPDFPENLELLEVQGMARRVPEAAVKETPPARATVTPTTATRRPK